MAHIPPAQGLGPAALIFSLVSPQFLEERVGRTHLTGLMPPSLPVPTPSGYLWTCPWGVGCAREKALTLEEGLKEGRDQSQGVLG